MHLCFQGQQKTDLIYLVWSSFYKLSTKPEKVLKPYFGNNSKTDRDISKNSTDFKLNRTRAINTKTIIKSATDKNQSLNRTTNVLTFLSLKVLNFLKNCGNPDRPS